MKEYTAVVGRFGLTLIFIVNGLHKALEFGESADIVADKGLNAGQIVREAGKEIKGGGGGQPFYATAGGKDVNGLQAAIEKALSFLQ